MILARLAIAALLIVAGTSAAAAADDGPLPWSKLRLEGRDIHGFGDAHRRVFRTASASVWARSESETESEYQALDANLIARGFQQGVFTDFEGRREGRRREAGSWVMVFSTVAGAEQQHEEDISTDSEFEHAHGYEVTTVPGATGIGGLFENGQRGGYANVLFSTGRCDVVVGNTFPRRPARALIGQPATAAAILLYKRLRTTCG
jgi:hypothetical protein